MTGFACTVTQQLAGTDYNRPIVNNENYYGYSYHKIATYNGFLSITSGKLFTLKYNCIQANFNEVHLLSKSMILYFIMFVI